MPRTKKPAAEDDSVLEKPETDSIPPNLTEAEIADKLEKAKIEGQQEVYTLYASYFKSRMMEYFENKQDDYAKEMREIYLLTIKNVT
jgi:hypothetical protein